MNQAAALHTLPGTGAHTAGRACPMFSNRELSVLLLPVLAEQVLTFCVGLADSIMVASLGEAAISGVSLVNFIVSLLSSLLSALATGGAVIAGQYLGASMPGKARQSANQLLWFVAAFSMVLAAFVFISQGFVLGTLFGHVDGDVRSHAALYLGVVLLSIPFMGAYSAGAAVFRTMGNERLPMRIAMFMGLCNVAGNLLALRVLDAGLAGVAASTVIARAAGAIVIVWFAFNPRLPLHFQKSIRHRFNWPVIRSIMAVGVPYGAEMGLFHLSRIIVLGLVASFGTAAIAANAVAGTIVLFQILPGIAFSMGQTVVVARCAGAGDFEQARYFNRKLLGLVYLSHFAASAIILAALPWLLAHYDLSPEAAAMTAKIVWWHAVFAVTIWPLGYSLPVTFRASGDARFPLAVSFITMFICRVALAFVLGGFLGLGLFGAWIAVFLDWLAKAIFFVFRYFSGAWMRKSVA